jgi:oligoendopeptidase F
VPLQAKVAATSQKYGTIIGSLMVEMEGKELTLQQASNYLKNTDRALREEAFMKINEARAAKAEELDTLFDELIALRHQIAVNAGFANYRDYKFAEMGRFDYAPQDCFNFHEAIQKQVIPLVKVFNEKRLAALGHTLKPWDMEVDVENKPALEPFTSGLDLLDKTIKCFSKIDDYFAYCIKTMDDMGRLDLESRKGKAPGGYNCPLAESGAPFIFMNAAGQMSDVTTMVHEGGHAIHSFLAHPLSLSAFKEYPMEMAEVASMSMELFTMNHWQSFFDNEEDLNRAKEHQLERTITIFPWIAIIDKFQHWVYENPLHTIEERTASWKNIVAEFSTDSIDYSGLDMYRAIGWQRQLHLFEVPFYYIEYGIAQLGAIGMWMQYQKNPTQALENYMNALSLGGTKTLPELYKTAGIEFNFSPDYVKKLMDFTNQELEKLYA